MMDAKKILGLSVGVLVLFYMTVGVYLSSNLHNVNWKREIQKEVNWWRVWWSQQDDETKQLYIWEGRVLYVQTMIVVWVIGWGML